MGPVRRSTSTRLKVRHATCGPAPRLVYSPFDTKFTDEEPEAHVIAMGWQFELTEGEQVAFERFYGADGPWTALSRRSRSYLGSSFLRDQVQPTRYLLIEYWSEMVVYEKHYADLSDEVAALEATRDRLCLSVTPLGVFTVLDIPSRSGPTWSRRDGV